MARPFVPPDSERDEFRPKISPFYCGAAALPHRCVVDHHLQLVTRPPCGFGQFPLPAGQGVVSFIVRVMGSIKSSNAITYTYPLPTVTNVLPRSFPTTGGTRLVITGSNLGIDIEVEYQHRLASHGPSERVLPLNDTIPNQVVLVQNSVAHPCVVTTVRFTLLTTLERRAASRVLVCRVFSRPVCRFMLVWLIFSCVMLFFLFG